MSFPAYDTYKDSGTELLGNIPFGWDVWKLAHAFTQIGSGTTPKSNKPEYYDEGAIPWVNTGDLDDGPLADCAKRITEKAVEDYTTLKLFPEGSLLFAMYGATIGKLGLLEFSATVNQACCVFSGESPINKKFLFYWFLGLKQRILSLATGGGQPNVSQDILRTLRVACPDEDEQKAISSFLDVETSKIDGLVSEQRRLIELLKEKRQAVISHAVTKGLNPNAPMKPSGIQWLGDVPQQWSVKPLKYLATFRSGGTPSKTVPAYWHGDVLWASSKDLKTETLADTIDHITQHALDSDAATLVPAGSVLVVVRGMILLHTFPVVQTLVPMAINQDLKALTPAECIDVSYLPWLLRGSTDATFGRIDEAAHGTKVLRMEGWTSIQLPVPPIDEQLEIVATVEKQLETLLRLQAEAKRAIELLQERRTALISAAVTGKIDVRESAPDACIGS